MKFLVCRGIVAQAGPRFLILLVSTSQMLGLQVEGTISILENYFPLNFKVFFKIKYTTLILHYYNIMERTFSQF